MRCPRCPQAYTPKHLAERIPTSKAALEGERKQVTVLVADLKGSMELLADRDPEEVAHEDHAVRACYVALRMQQAVKQSPRTRAACTGATVT